MTHKRGVVDGAADEAGFPLIVKLTDMFASPDEFLQSIALKGPKKPMVPSHKNLLGKSSKTIGCHVAAARPCAAIDPKELSFPRE
jgi:hypothetical protein